MKEAKKNLVLISVLIIGMLIMLIGDGRAKIITKNTEYDFSEDISANYEKIGDTGYLTDGQGRECTFTLNGMNSYSEPMTDGVEIFFTKELKSSDLLTINNIVPKLIVNCNNEEAFAYLDWDVVKQEYSEPIYDSNIENPLIIGYNTKPQAFDYSRKKLGSNTEEITITLNNKYLLNWKENDKIVIDPIYTISNITIDAEMNDVVCEGGGYYCHSQLNDSSIVLYMPMVGNNSNTEYDWSDYNNDGTVSGAFFNATGGVDGYGAYEFDGVDDYIDVSNYFNLDIATLSFWINSNSWSNEPMIISKNGGGATNGYIEYYSSQLSYAAPGNINTVSWGSPSLNSWHHVTLVVTGTQHLAYLNGLLIGSPTTSSLDLFTGDYNFQIGRYNTGGVNYNGSIDQVMIFNRALSADEILAINNSQFGLLKSNGNLTSNITIDSGYNAVDITIHEKNQINSNLQLGLYDGFSWTDFYTMENGIAQSFTISNESTNLNLTFKFNPDSYSHYSPILMSGLSSDLQITINTYKNQTLSLYPNTREVPYVKLGEKNVFE